MMSQKMTQLEALTWASNFLQADGREAYVANILLAYHLQVDTAQLHETMQAMMPEDVLECFQADVKHHVVTGKPVQHITGEAYFYGRKFHVNEEVLIPRYDTEFVLQAVIDYVKEQASDEPIMIADIGTGSGIIAITLALELPNVIVLATDISQQALELASKNATAHGATIRFMQGDFVQPVIAANLLPHIIISNPPYIPKAEASMLTDTVKAYDPAIALYGGETGLEAYEAITKQAEQLATNLQFIAYEIGYNQGKAVSAIVKECFPQAETRIGYDFQQLERVVTGKLCKNEE